MSQQEPKHAYRIPPCPVYDVEGMESWLADMAAKGLVLCKDGFFAGVAAFEKTEPCSMRYRLEPAPKNVSIWSEGSMEPSPEAVELSAHYGWRYIATWGQFFIYCTDQPGARELNTDPAVQALALDLVRRRERGSLLSTLFWLLVYPLLLLRGGVLLTVTEIGTWRVLWATAMVFWAVWISAAAVFSLRRLRKKLAAGEPLSHRKNWKRNARQHRLGLLLFLVQAIAWVICMLSAWKADIMETNVRPLAEDPGPYPFATLADLAAGGTYRQEDSYRSNRVERRSDWLAPVIIEYREYGSGKTEAGERFQGGLIIEYYETATPWLAREIGREYLSEARRNKHYKEIPLKGLDADWSAAYHEIFPTVLLQKGSRIMRITFYQTADSTIPVEEWAGCFAAHFSSQTSNP